MDAAVVPAVLCRVVRCGGFASAGGKTGSWPPSVKTDIIDKAVVVDGPLVGSREIREKPDEHAIL